MTGRALNGYSDVVSVAPGGRIVFYVSCEGYETYDARIVRLICADDNPKGAPFHAEPVKAPCNGSHPGHHQIIHAGSHGVVDPAPDFMGPGGFTLQALVMPTTPGSRKQGLLGTWSETGQTGASLILAEDGSLGFVAGDGDKSAMVSTGVPLSRRAWYRVAAVYDDEGQTVRLHQEPLNGGKPLVTTAPLALAPVPGDGKFLIAAWQHAHPDGRGYQAGCFNGRVEKPCVSTLALDVEELAQDDEDSSNGVVASWDFSLDISSERLTDVSGNGHHGETVHLPQRGMRGAGWTGREMCWRHAPEEYGAIHFHDDDVYDSDWRESFAWTVPVGTRSGIYAAHITTGEHEEFMPFCVRPPKGTATAEVCFLYPTGTYVAYANSGRHFRNDTVEMKQFRATVMTTADCFLQEHSEYGLSTYDTHSDGSGVSVSSRLRPILNMRPKVRVWGLAADTHITSWLEHDGQAYDVISDEDLHAEGFELLSRYRVVITGTHPEYHTTEMLDALAAFTKAGGRLIYTGANGFYWRIAYHPKKPGVIECRKTEGGTRSWVSEVGESFMSFTGEYGGLWRRSGRTPQQLTGIGFTAQGFDWSSWYERRPGSYDTRAAFIFEGLAEDEKIGDFGLVGGGAAGLELDRCDYALGSPPHTLVLASSAGHSEGMLVVIEELTSNQPVIGPNHPKVHADMTFFELDGGGAVFSTGSIAWAGSLPINGFDNNVATVMRNVLSRFLDSKPFTGFDASAPASRPMA
ncbi:MAG: N,N-dimethylformamidase beta subunit family domain-containing protein [Pseudomonadota bacterium]